MCKNTSFEMFEDVFIVKHLKMFELNVPKNEILKINYSAIIVSFVNELMLVRVDQKYDTKSKWLTCHWQRRY